MQRTTALALIVTVACGWSTALGQGGPPPPPPGPLLPPPVPPQNPQTPSKVVLGKMLFWEEQLSSDDTVACGTCHRSEFGGSDGRSLESFGSNPGFDGIFWAASDMLDAEMMLSPELSRISRPSSTLVPSRRTTNGCCS